MATTEGTVGVFDTVSAALVECAPVEAPVSVPLPDAPDTTPTRAASDATIAVTGADPPPQES